MCCIMRNSGLIAMVGLAALGAMAFTQPEKKEGGGAGGGQAQPNQEEMDAWMKASSPGEHHRHLDAMAGEWVYKMKMWMDPSQPASESSGEQKNYWIIGGRHLAQATTGTFMGMPFEGFGTWGYDNVTKKYVSTWVDSTMTGVMNMEGSCDGAGKSFTMNGSFNDPMGGPIKSRQVTTVKDGNSFLFEFFMVGPDGKETKSMEIAYTRKPGTTKPVAPKPRAAPAGK